MTTHKEGDDMMFHLKVCTSSSESKEVSKRVRGFALHLCNKLLKSVRTINRVYRVDKKDDVKMIGDDLAKHRCRKILLWIDSASDIMPDINKLVSSLEVEIVCLVTSGDKESLEKDEGLLKKLDYLGMEQHEYYEVKGAVNDSEVALSNTRGTISISSFDDDGRERCLLKHLKRSNKLQDFTKKLGGILAVQLNAMNFYSNDDNSACVKVCISSLKQLKELFENIFVAEKDLKNKISVLQSCGSIQFNIPEVLQLYEKTALKLDTLTSEQEDLLEKYMILEKRKGVSHLHIKGVAGTGKTFLALHILLESLNENKGKNDILFVCRNPPLAFHFMKWIYRRLDSSIKQKNLFQRMSFLTTKGLAQIGIGSDGKMLMEYKDMEDKKFGYIIIDECHEVFKNNTKIDSIQKLLEIILEKNLDCTKIMLSDPSQASSSNITYPEGFTDFTINKVSRSSQRFVAGSMGYRLGDISKIKCSHSSTGPPLMVSVFKSPEDTNIYEVYARKVIDAIDNVLDLYSCESLHGRLAIIVPTEDFLNKFRVCFLAMQNHNVRTVPAEEASRVLNLTKVDGPSLIVLDTVSEVRGLEYLFVFGVGLDQLNKDVNQESSLDLSRSQIYCAMTRCQFHFTLVNEFIEGGLFEWLQNVEESKEDFSFNDEIKHINTRAATALTEKEFEPSMTDKDSFDKYQETSGSDKVKSKGSTTDHSDFTEGFKISSSVWSFKNKDNIQLTNKVKFNPLSYRDNSTEMLNSQNGNTMSVTEDSGNDRQQILRLRYQQQRLLLLRYAAKCPHEDGKCPVTPHCAEMKRVWEHICKC